MISRLTLLAVVISSSAATASAVPFRLVPRQLNDAPSCAIQCLNFKFGEQACEWYSHPSQIVSLSQYNSHLLFTFAIHARISSFSFPFFPYLPKIDVIFV